MSDQERPPPPEHSLAVRKPRTVGGAIYLGVLAATLAGLVVVVLDRWQLGLTMMGVAMLVGAVSRLVLPDESAGMLGVRRKFVDVLTLLLLGGGLVVLAAVIPTRAG